MNLLMSTDSYKHSHHKQYPPNTTQVYSYLEARKGSTFSHTVFFGLQPLLTKLTQGFSLRDIEEAEYYLAPHFGSSVFNKQGWLDLLVAHKGALPLCIRAVPEGSLVPEGNVLMTIHNTDPRFPWLTNFVETLLMQVWYPCTVATVSYEARQIIERFARLTGDPNNVDFQLHDFGVRGTSSMESAAIGGLAHLVNFKGTDNLPALVLAREEYDKNCAGHSVPASEHSTMTSWGKDGEKDAYRNMLKQYPTGIVSIVADSWDILNSVSNIFGGTLKDEILTRDGVTVIRPDSGVPEITVLDVLNRLSVKFGHSLNEKGYKVLPKCIKVLQGDGLDLERIEKVLPRMEQWKWSSDNVVFGMGGGLLQKVDRDTQRFALKCSQITKSDGQTVDVYKSPKSDLTKASKKGRLSLYKDSDGNYKTVKEDLDNDYLQTVFGPCFAAATTLDEVRKRLRSENPNSKTLIEVRG